MNLVRLQAEPIHPEELIARVRADACHYLALTGKQKVLPVLQAMLQDDDPQVREVAAEGLAARRLDPVEAALAAGTDFGEAAEAVSELFNRYGHGGAVIEALAPDEPPAPDAVLSIDDLAPDPPDDPTLDAFESWLEKL